MSEYAVDPAHPHLGGYLIGGDQATFYPDLWEWLVDMLEVRTVWDVGCGEGWALRHFRERGCVAHGVEGLEQDDPDICVHDYTTGKFMPSEYDLAWCCEFVEHVEEQYVPNFLATFRHARYVVMTHGMPGQPGHHHVNNQAASYWKGALAAIGFRFDRELTSGARARASLNQHPSNHFVRSGLVFQAPRPGVT